MTFMRAWVRRGLCALGAARVLPRELLREIGEWLCADDPIEFVGIFNKYATIKHVTGLYLRAVLDGMRGPRMAVGNVSMYAFLNTNGVICRRYCINNNLVLLFNEPHQCIKHPGAHFCARLDEMQMGFVGHKPCMPMSTYHPRVEFDADCAIEFVHKGLHKLIC